MFFFCSSLAGFSVQDAGGGPGTGSSFVSRGPQICKIIMRSPSLETRSGGDRGEFAKNVEVYLLKLRSPFRLQEDRAHCAWPSEEFHLGMVGV
jgi:hypothetical protein